MKKTAVLLYPEFSEYELTTALSILMQGGKILSFIGLKKEPIKGEAGLVCLPECEISEVDLNEYDSLLLPGCMNIANVIEVNEYIQFIRDISIQENFIIASISSSPILLAKAGVLKGKKYTVAMMEDERKASPYFEEKNYEEKLVVTDGNLITAWGPAFVKWAVLFGEALGLKFEEGWYRE